MPICLRSIAPSRSLLATAALLTVLSSTGAGAGEAGNLDINMPNTLDDAFLAGRGSIELQGAARYDRRHGHDTVRFFPRLQVGVTDQLQARPSSP